MILKAGVASSITLPVLMLDGTGLKLSGIISVLIYDQDTNEYFSTDAGGSWETRASASFPTATLVTSGEYYYYAIPTAVTSGLDNHLRLSLVMVDNTTPASITAMSPTVLIEVMTDWNDVDAIWDESLTGATHNVATSSGKRLRQLGGAESFTVNDASATTTVFITDLTSSTDAWYNDTLIYFTSGNLAGLTRIIVDYEGATKTVTIDEALPEAPANGDDFDLTSGHAHPISQIIDANWDELLSGHTDVGSAGESLNEAGPVGVRAITIHTQDGSSNNVGGVIVSLYTNSGRTGDPYTRVTTDASGNAVIGLADDTYYWAATKGLYTFTSSSFAVVGTATVNLTGTSVAPASPSAPNGCIVYGTVYYGVAAVVSETVQAIYRVPDSVSGTALSQKIASTTTDSNGYFELELIQGAEVIFRCDTLGMHGTYIVPSSSSQDVTTWDAESNSTSIKIT